MWPLWLKAASASSCDSKCLPAHHSPLLFRVTGSGLATRPGQGAGYLGGIRYPRYLLGVLGQPHRAGLGPSSEVQFANVQRYVLASTPQVHYRYCSELVVALFLCSGKESQGTKLQRSLRVPSGGSHVQLVRPGWNGPGVMGPSRSGGSQGTVHICCHCGSSLLSLPVFRIF